MPNRTNKGRLKPPPLPVREGYLKPIPPLPRERAAGRKVCINPESYLKP